MENCEAGQAGFLITRGKNLMSGYIGKSSETGPAFHDGWYLGLGDICFDLINPVDRECDTYWVSRESNLLIRGGANYAFDQINTELTRFISRTYDLPADAFDLAVVGLKVESEHEDACCVTVALKTDAARERRERIEKSFLTKAARSVSKGARPDHLRFGPIPRNFKGAVQVKALAESCRAWLGKKRG
jgi:acyl-CoA synthetase (AMP-forming)/AMP-acid ligase II